MPEGDTIYKIAAALRPALEGAVLRRLRVGRGPHLSAGCARGEDFEGRRVVRVYSEGKHLFIELEGGLLVRSHLGLHGSWHRYRPGEAWRRPERRASLALWTEQDVFVCFNAREVECLNPAGFRRADLSARLGPDLLSPHPDLDAVVRRARELLDPEARLADALLDQRIAAGIGNVYKSEVLFLRGRHPDALLQTASDPVLRGLFEAARDLLLRNLGGGPRTTRFAADGRGKLWVYGRAGRPCYRCGTRIRFARSGRGMRSTYWCPACQPAGGPASMP